MLLSLPFPSSASEFCPRHGDQGMDASDLHGMLSMDSARYVPYFPATLPIGYGWEMLFFFQDTSETFLSLMLEVLCSQRAKKVL